MNLMQKIYQTKRLDLKILDSSHASLVLDYYRRNRVFLAEWESLKPIDFYTLAYQAEELEYELACIEQETRFRLWIFKKGVEDRTIGCFGFSNIVRGAFLSCFLGYKLDEAEINNGYMTEAVQKGIEIIFNQFNLHRIEANIMPKNKRSLRVVEKLGFYNEGVAYKYWKWEDHIHNILLNDKV